MSTEVTVRAPQQGAAHAIARMRPEDVGVLKATVAKGATDSELAMFLELAQRYSLDPFAKEIWCYKRGSDPVIAISRDGYLAIADRHPAYEGMESDVVREGDDFRRSPEGVEHAYGAERGEILGAYAVVYRRGRKPAFFFAPFSEYKASGPTWRTYPSAMIQKVAESMALKRAFSVSGLVSLEEIESSQTPAAARGDGPAAGESEDERWNRIRDELRQLAEATGKSAEFGQIMADAGLRKMRDLDDVEKVAAARRAFTGEVREDEPLDGEVVGEGPAAGADPGVEVGGTTHAAPAGESPEEAAERDESWAASGQATIPGTEGATPAREPGDR